MREKFRFSRNFDFAISPRALVAYKAGDELVIPQAHAEAAKAAGAGAFVSEPAPKKRASKAKP